MGRHRSNGAPGNYIVGYRKPPKASQFKPGNRAAKGRRKARADDRNFESGLKRTLSQRVEVTTMDGVRRLTKMELLAEQLINALIKKPPTNPRQVSELMQLIGRLSADRNSANSIDLGAVLRKKIDDMADRLNQEAERENQLPESDEEKK